MIFFFFILRKKGNSDNQTFS